MKTEDKKKLLSDFFKFFIDKGEMSCDQKTADYFVSAFLNESPLSDSPEEIDCPWCEGKGWVVEPDGENEPAQFPCQACDLNGRISSKTIRDNWANAEKLRALDPTPDDDLPF